MSGDLEVRRRLTAPSSFVLHQISSPFHFLIFPRLRRLNSQAADTFISSVYEAIKIGSLDAQGERDGGSLGCWSVTSNLVAKASAFASVFTLVGRGGMGTRAKLAKRALETDMPVMVQELMRGTKEAISLAQGVVYWQPPEQALEKVKQLIGDPSISKYGADEGLPELRQALIEKLQRENNLNKSAVMVTAGANQVKLILFVLMESDFPHAGAFVNVVLTLCDPGDSVVMFVPYYFNARMAFQMTGVTDILVGPSDPETLQPDVEWLEKTLSQDPIPKLVTVVNPGNPSGAYIPEPLLLKMSDLCKRAGAWFVVDNTYE
ncbi:hypothetical protein ZIOFF_016254 [Zingiber officinale]|uniref:Aminotransferase class I/classII large domain-containing protein n=1 Tax=Zingiber officinale TaxID=94328 RepID=A0A8J5HK56_ZINOF|nr:hypothetical protein ZIOFF_016254 [Zingiber officinale]